MKSFKLDVKENDDGELYIEFTDEILQLAGWKIGDNLDWKDNGDGSFTLTKKEPTEWVLVDCVSTFRKRYMVEVPQGKSDWALDTVTMNEAKEFSQEYLGEQIVSHRVVSESEALSLCHVDNEYATWSDEKVKSTFFTTIADLEDKK